jgi:hypothetical protein
MRCGVGTRQMADLAELEDWLEGIRAAAHNAQDGSSRITPRPRARARLVKL